MEYRYRGLIYAVYCIVSGKWYIGQTIRDLDTRKNEHIHDSFDEKDEAYNYKFHRAIRKYGVENFVWFVIEDNILVPYHYENGEEVQDKSLLNEREIYWVDYYDSFKHGYNMTPGGNQNPVNGVPVLQYTKDGVFVAEYANMGQASRMTNIVNLASMLSMGLTFIGGYIWVKKISDDYPLTIKPYKNNKGQNTRKAVLQYTLDGDFVAEYPSSIEAGKAININGKAILATLNRGNHFSNDFLWYKKTSDNYPKKIEPYQKYDQNRTSILQYTLDGDFVAEYKGFGDMELKTGLCGKYVCSALHNNHRYNKKTIAKSYGFMWTFKESDNYPLKIEPYQKTKRSDSNSICQYTKEGVLVGKYDSVSIAAKTLGITHSAISLCANGKRPSAGGYYWAYAS